MSLKTPEQKNPDLTSLVSTSGGQNNKITLTASKHPLERAIGAFRDDPTWDELIELIQEFRHQLDTENVNE